MQPTPSSSSVRSTIPAPFERGVRARIRAFSNKYAKVLWWAHSAYALTLGISVVVFAQKGFEHARMLAVSIGAAWLLLLLLFRLFGTESTTQNASAAFVEQGSKPRVDVRALRFFAMTYLLKNLYQGMLFFLLPFYWKASTLDSINVIFVGVLGVFALLSTLDVVFDRVLMKVRILGGLFHGFTLFACLNLVVPALISETPVLVSLLASVAIAVLSFFSLHLPLAALRNGKGAALLVLALGMSLGLAYAGRSAIPPVPMYLAHAAVGPQVMANGRLAMEVKTLDASVVTRLVAVTDVALPSGKGDRLVHVWRRNGHAIQRSDESTSRVAGPDHSVRLRSTLDQSDLPKALAGNWSVDVETEDGQLVGRTKFAVTE